MASLRVLMMVFLISWLAWASETDEDWRGKAGLISANSSQRVLSRKRRYLIFPEGSSLQLVYCLTAPVIGYHTMFTFGGTAALAWELPFEPYRFHKDRKKLLDYNAENRVDKIQDKNGNSGGWGVSSPSTPQKRIDFVRLQPPVTPIRYKQTYADPWRRKYSTYKTVYNDKIPKKSYIQKTHNKWQYQPPKRQYYDVYEDQWRHHVHRRTKRELYTKIIDFFRTQSKDGKACLLKAICEVNQAPDDHSGSFIQEIIKAIFRYKPHENLLDEENDQYDEAYSKEHNCMQQYPSCNSSIWNHF